MLSYAFSSLKFLVTSVAEVDASGSAIRILTLEYCEIGFDSVDGVEGSIDTDSSLGVITSLDGRIELISCGSIFAFFAFVFVSLFLGSFLVYALIERIEAVLFYDD